MKNNKLIFMIFTLACFVAAGVCLIVDMASNQQITWAVLPLLSIAFGWAALSPLSVKKHGILLSLCAVTLLTLPYLYLLNRIITTIDWFVPIGLPSAIAGIIALWVLFSLFRFAKMNIWGKLALSIFLLGAVISPVVNYFVDKHTGQNPFSWDIFLTIMVAVAASAVLGISGYMKSKPGDAGEKGI
jgi:peptidoglycan/LPS O-acetylase OafA/YrhL